MPTLSSMQLAEVGVVFCSGYNRYRRSGTTSGSENSGFIFHTEKDVMVNTTSD